MNYTLQLLTTSLTITATAVFPENFLAFQGHFPNHPLLPGFMHIQLALDVLRAANLPHNLKEISTAKFSAPILPNASVTVTLTLTAPNLYDVTLAVESGPASAFTLLVAP